MTDGYTRENSGWNQTVSHPNDTSRNNATDFYNDLESMNVSSNGNVTKGIDSFYFYQTEQFTVLWLLFAVIVVGNTTVLATLLLGKRRKSRMDFFIKQLAFADLMVGLISVLTDIVWRLTVAWYAGNVACKIIRFMQVVVTYSSTYVLVALSIDRYDAITRPMNFSGSWWRARVLIATAWGLSVLFSIPIIFLYEEKLIQGTLQCWIDLGSPVQWQIYMSLVSFTLFVAPTLIIAACYAFIVFTIWSQGGTLQNGPTRELRRASARGLIPRAKIKTVKMTFVIVFVFILCWSPYIIFDLLQVYGHVPTSQTNIAVATFIQSLAPLNSAANPIIYCLFSTPFCKHIRNMQAVSWVSGWCTTIPQHCLGTDSAQHSTRTTMTTSLTTHSSHSRGQLAVLHSSSSKKRVMRDAPLPRREQHGLSLPSAVSNFYRFEFDTGTAIVSRLTGCESSQSLVSSITDGSFKEGKGDAGYQDLRMQMTTIMRNKPYNTLSDSSSMNLDEYQFFKDRYTVMRKRNQYLIEDNKALQNQLAIVADKNKELEEQFQILQKATCDKMVITKPDVKDAVTETTNDCVTKKEDVKTFKLCPMCAIELQTLEMQEPTVILTKSELEKLENDMQMLKDAIEMGEKSCDKAVEREKIYREQLARSSIEITNTRQLLEVRNNELQNLNAELETKRSDVKLLQKELTNLRKQIGKQKKHQNIRNEEKKLMILKQQN